MIYAGLIPGLHIASTYRTGTIAPGCFGPGPDVTNGELFWWEVGTWHCFCTDWCLQEQQAVIAYVAWSMCVHAGSRCLQSSRSK